jgi:ribosomal protein S18 acetylase RimI-like enzyme
MKTLIEELLNNISDEFNPPLNESIDIKQYSEKIIKNATILSIIDSGKLAGFMAVYCNDPAKNVGYGTMLAVSKTHRIYGIGPQLIKMTVDYLRKRGFKKFSLEIYKTNPRVIILYKRLGFLIEKETEKSVFAYKNLSE